MQDLALMKIMEEILKGFKLPKLTTYNSVVEDKKLIVLPTIVIEWWYGFTIRVGFLCWVVQLEWSKNDKLYR